MQEDSVTSSPPAPPTIASRVRHAKHGNRYREIATGHLFAHNSSRISRDGFQLLSWRRSEASDAGMPTARPSVRGSGRPSTESRPFHTWTSEHYRDRADCRWHPLCPAGGAADPAGTARHRSRVLPYHRLRHAHVGRRRGSVTAPPARGGRHLR